MASLPVVCHIFRIPGELIFKILQYLLPVIRDTADSRHPFSPGDLSDLLRCRLVCGALYDIASSLVWRRVKLMLPGYKSSVQPVVSAAYDDASRLTKIVDFLTHNSRFTNDIRLLIMTANGPLHERALHRITVTALSNVVPLLINIRVLNLDNVSILDSRIMLQLFLCPVLHTVRLGNLDFSSLSVSRTVVNPSIKCLGIHRCRKAEKLFKFMPSIRAFDGEVDEASARMARWGSLSEISFRSNSPKWGELARIFVSWREFRRNVSPPSLTEIMISQWHFSPKIRDLESIIRPFVGNPLTKLILYYVEEPSLNNLKLIIHFFPGLQHLSLLSDEELAQWPSDIESYGGCLSSLSQLQLLEWNFYDGDSDRTVYRDWSTVSEDRLSEIVLSLADDCPGLKEVRFCLVIDGYMGFTLHRDSSGNTDIENVFYSDSLIFCTSSWSPSSLGDI